MGILCAYFYGSNTCIAIYMPGYLVSALLLGLVPFSVLAILVAEICHVRLQSPLLFLIHNQLFLVLVWCAVICILRTPISSPYLDFVGKCLALVGLKKQPISIDSPFRALIGDYSWMESSLIRDEDAMSFL
ncbi:hypothetical protein THRCLA_11887 [Thraustotheca clavata]|uniref:Uncharacterized protein n=1 Tax=Thraustotheca clavata TaxID=74557 RepID=A0A1V9Y5U0_9STRA|nr:hypothetical protein THRCLA_11887 [Thraustotheca clavata]